MRRGLRRPDRPAPAERSGPGLSRPVARGRLARAIFAAQVTNLLRDRRALFAAFLLPILIYPILFLGQSMLGRFATEALEARTVRVAIDASRAPEAHAQRLRAALEHCLPIEVDDVDASTIVDGWEWALGPESNDAARTGALAFLARGYDAFVLALPAERPGQWAVLTYYDGTQDSGNEAQRRLSAATLALHDQLADEQRMALLGYDPARGLTLSPIDVALPQDRGGAQLGRWLPLLAIFVLLGGASHAALSAFAGEREAGTLETLLVQPVPSTAIVAAKFAAVLAVGVTTLVLNAGSVIASLAAGLGSLPGSHGEGFALDVTRVLGGALAFLPAAVLVCALLCLVCGRARTFREGQNLLLPLLLITIVPTLPALEPDVQLDALLAAVPLCGPSLVLRDALRGSVSLPLAAWMFVASSGWAALALWRLARALDSENLLQHAENEDELAVRHTQSRTALRYGFVVVFAVYVVGGTLQARDPVWGLAATLWILLPLATWLSARGTARRAHETWTQVLALRVPHVAHAAAAILAAPAIALLARQLFAWQRSVLPLPASVERVALPIEIAGLPLVGQVLLLAVSPAICEELFFRGALLSGMRRDLAAWRVIAWQAFLFGAVHASIYRFVPTAVVGAALAALVLRTRSVVPAILLHLCYNTILVLGDRLPWLADPRLAWIGLAAPLLLLVRPRSEGTSRTVPDSGRPSSA